MDSTEYYLLPCVLSKECCVKMSNTETKAVNGSVSTIHIATQGQRNHFGQSSHGLTTFLVKSCELLHVIEFTHKWPHY